MSETASSNRWIPFQCPSCFSLFRIKKGQLGQTGRCPICSAVVQPCENENTRILHQAASQTMDDDKLLSKVAVAQEMTPDQLEKVEAGRRSRRQYVAEDAEGTAWEHDAIPNKVSWKVVVSIVLSAFVLLTLGLFYYKNSGSSPMASSSKPVIDREKTDALLDEIEKTNQNTKEIDDGEIAALTVDDFERFDNDKLEETIKKFLMAESLEELKKYIRDIDRVGPLIDRYYENVDYEVEGFEKLNRQQISYQGDLVTAMVQKATFLTSPIALERVLDGEKESYKIDWESWVGYCDYTPEQMREKRPNKPFLMRVIVEPASYYNYDFSDDRKWRSLGLEVKDSIYSFLGYVERESEEDKKFRVLMKNGRMLSCMVKVAYPVKSRAADQLEILEILGDGWVTKQKKESKDD